VPPMAGHPLERREEPGEYLGTQVSGRFPGHAESLSGIAPVDQGSSRILRRTLRGAMRGRQGCGRDHRYQ
jgi:hypothetical protein